MEVKEEEGEGQMLKERAWQSQMKGVWAFYLFTSA
jgi:hypothetical protein